MNCFEELEKIGACNCALIMCEKSDHDRVISEINELNSSAETYSLEYGVFITDLCFIIRIDKIDNYIEDDADEDEIDFMELGEMIGDENWDHGYDVFDSLVDDINAKIIVCHDRGIYSDGPSYYYVYSIFGIEENSPHDIEVVRNFVACAYVIYDNIAMEDLVVECTPEIIECFIHTNKAKKIKNYIMETKDYISQVDTFGSWQSFYAKLFSEHPELIIEETIDIYLDVFDKTPEVTAVILDKSKDLNLNK